MAASRLAVLVLVAAAVIAAAAGAASGLRHGRRVLGSNGGGGEKAAPAVEQLWFTQKVDHFGGTAGTFQQRYFVNATFYRAGGPVFVQIGGEAPIDQSIVSAYHELVYAQEFGAVFVALEHRFYGESQPTGDLSTASLALLTSDQALADLAAWQQWLTVELGVQGAPWVYFGCSYPACLATWMRVKYPQLSVGSVASSGPVQATLDFYQYLDVVVDALDDDTGDQCIAAIGQASAQVQQLLATPAGQRQLADDFSLCAPLNGSLDEATLMSNLAGWVMGVVQYDDEVPSQPTIVQLCQLMANAQQTPYQNWRDVNTLFLKQSGTPCLDCSYADAIAQMRNTTDFSGIGGRSWMYQSCTEFGFFQTTDSAPAQAAFGDLVPLSYYTQMCADIFGLDAAFDYQAAVNATNVDFGGNQPRASNVLFVNGSYDPWHALSVTANITATERAILIPQGAHCSNTFWPAPGLPPTLAQAQAEERAQIAQWLSDFASAAK